MGLTAQNKLPTLFSKTQTSQLQSEFHSLRIQFRQKMRESPLFTNP
jgi:hypothetical protein